MSKAFSCHDRRVRHRHDPHAPGRHASAAGSSLRRRPACFHRCTRPILNRGYHRWVSRMTTLLSTWSSHLPPRVGARGAIRERWFKLSLALGAFCVCAAGCTETHGGRPTVMCGTMVNPGGPGAFIVDEVPTDSPSAGSSTVRVDANTLILVATGCGTGADVTFSRPDVTMGPVAYAKDGKPVIFGLSSAISPQDP